MPIQVSVWLLLLLGGANHLTQLILLGELARENAQILHQFMASGNDPFLGSDLTVGLNTEFDLGDQGVRSLWTCQRVGDKNGVG